MRHALHTHQIHSTSCHSNLSTYAPLELRVKEAFAYDQSTHTDRERSHHVCVVFIPIDIYWLDITS